MITIIFVAWFLTMGILAIKIHMVVGTPLIILLKGMCLTLGLHVLMSLLFSIMLFLISPELVTHATNNKTNMRIIDIGIACLANKIVCDILNLPVIFMISNIAIFTLLHLVSMKNNST